MEPPPRRRGCAARVAGSHQRLHGRDADLLERGTERHGWGPDRYLTMVADERIRVLGRAWSTRIRSLWKRCDAIRRCRAEGSECVPWAIPSAGVALLAAMQGCLAGGVVEGDRGLDRDCEKADRKCTTRAPLGRPS